MPARINGAWQEKGISRGTEPEWAPVASGRPRASRPQARMRAMQRAALVNASQAAPGPRAGIGNAKIRLHLFSEITFPPLASLIEDLPVAIPYVSKLGFKSELTGNFYSNQRILMWPAILGHFARSGLGGVGGTMPLMVVPATFFDIPLSNS